MKIKQVAVQSTCKYVLNGELTSVAAKEANCSFVHRQHVFRVGAGLSNPGFDVHADQVAAWKTDLIKNFASLCHFLQPIVQSGTFTRIDERFDDEAISVGDRIRGNQIGVDGCVVLQCKIQSPCSECVECVDHGGFAAIGGQLRIMAQFSACEHRAHAFDLRGAARRHVAELQPVRSEDEMWSGADGRFLQHLQPMLEAHDVVAGQRCGACREDQIGGEFGILFGMGCQHGGLRPRQHGERGIDTTVRRQPAAGAMAQHANGFCIAGLSELILQEAAQDRVHAEVARGVGRRAAGGSELSDELIGRDGKIEQLHAFGVGHLGHGFAQVDVEHREERRFDQEFPHGCGHAAHDLSFQKSGQVAVFGLQQELAAFSGRGGRQRLREQLQPGGPTGDVRFQCGELFRVERGQPAVLHERDELGMVEGEIGRADRKDAVFEQQAPDVERMLRAREDDQVQQRPRLVQHQLDEGERLRRFEHVQIIEDDDDMSVASRNFVAEGAEDLLRRCVARFVQVGYAVDSRESSSEPRGEVLREHIGGIIIALKGKPDGQRPFRFGTLPDVAQPQRGEGALAEASWRDDVDQAVVRPAQQQLNEAGARNDAVSNLRQCVDHEGVLLAGNSSLSVLKIDESLH